MGEPVRCKCAFSPWADAVVGAFAHLASGGSLKAAADELDKARAAGGAVRGPLHGIPFAAKVRPMASRVLPFPSAAWEWCTSVR